MRYSSDVLGPALLNSRDFSALVLSKVYKRIHSTTVKYRWSYQAIKWSSDANECWQTPDASDCVWPLISIPSQFRLPSAQRMFTSSGNHVSAMGIKKGRGTSSLKTLRQTLRKHLNCVHENIETKYSFLQFLLTELIIFAILTSSLLLLTCHNYYS